MKKRVRLTPKEYFRLFEIVNYMMNTRDADDLAGIREKLRVLGWVACRVPHPDMPDIVHCTIKCEHEGTHETTFNGKKLEWA